MRNNVIEFFQNLPENKAEQFNKAFELYRQSPDKSEGIERVLNASGYSELSLSNLLYDLQKLHNISDIEKLPAEKEVENTDFRLELLDKVKDLTQPDFLVWLNDFKESNLKIDELIEFAENNENDLAVLVLSEISFFKGKVDFIEFIIDKTIEEITQELGVLNPKIEDWETARDFATSINNEKAVEKINEIISNLTKPVVSDANLSIKLDDSQSIENQELKNLNEELLDENDNLNLKNEELEDENEELKNQLEESKTLPVISAESIRVEFPFLSEKDCPNELKILVADKITAWNEYLVLHDQLAKAESGEITLTPEELQSKAKRSVECFDENQKIYQELNAYNETGKVLGNHPIFRTLKLKEEVEKMTLDEKRKYINSTSKFFTVNNKDLELAKKNKDDERVEKLTRKIAERTEKLNLVNASLGIK